jgi:uncharacterized membrane protein
MAKFFSLKVLLFAKHSQHIVLIHFPIALFITALFFEIFALWRKDITMRKVAGYNLRAAAISSIAAFISGSIAWGRIYDGGFPRGLGLYHMIGAGTTVLLLITLVFLRRGKDDAVPLQKAFWVVAILAVLMISVTAHLGGILSGLIEIGE